MIETLEEIKQKMQELIQTLSERIVEQIVSTNEMRECYNNGVQDCIDIIDEAIKEEKENPFQDPYM